jgi:PPOX class probable F420-dependent enzyme
VATLAYHRVMSDTLQLPDHVAAFLAAPGRFATLASIDPDGAPRQAVIWYTFEPDGRITINSLDGRRWPANLGRNGRLSLSIADPADGYRFVALAGVVDEVITDQAIARGDISAMARRYHPDDLSSAKASIAVFETQQRITFRIRITAFHDHLS